MIFGKTCILIEKTPKGETSQEIREKWVDLRLPLETTKKHQGFAGGVISHRPTFSGGYVVDAILAIEILGLHHPDANFWWRDNTKIAYTGGHLIFEEDACRVVEGLPSFTYPTNQPGMVTVGEFFDRLYEEFGDSGWLFDNIQTTFRLEWDELLRQTLTIPMVLVFAKIIARDAGRQLNACSSEEMFNKFHREGHSALQALHRAAWSCGICIPGKMVDLPLSYVDMAVRDGVMELTEDGTVRLTEEGGKMVEEGIEIEKRIKDARNN